MNAFIEKLKSAPGFVCMKPSSDDQITMAEQTLGLKFSQEFREYAAAFGAACIRNHELTGICSSKRLNVEHATLSMREFYPEIPRSLYVVEETSVDGIIILQDETGAVYAAAPGVNVKQIATSLSEYLKL